ncbi:MAG: DMT family transporter [Clostridia bacterium]|nr:DMT family transporter [Clostridia bacterium]
MICHIFWGFSFMASDYALKIAHVFLLLSHRFLAAFIVMSLLVLFRAARLDLKGKRVWLLLILGILEPVVYFFGEQFGILHSGTVFSGVMIAMIPVVCTLAAALFLRERPTAGQLIFCVISVCGVIGIGLMGSGSGTVELIGAAALIVAVVGAAGYTLLSRKLSNEFTPFERTYMMIAVGAAVFTVCAAVKCGFDPAEYFRPLANGGYVLCVLFLSVCCSVICYFMASYAITYMSVSRTTVFANLTTAVSVFAGVVFLHEPFSWLGLVCCVLILVGIYGVQKTARRDG